MTIYIDNDETVKTYYSVKPDVVKAITTLLELDEDLIWSETHPGYCAAIVEKSGEKK